MISTKQRVESNTSDTVNQQIEAKTRDSVSKLTGAGSTEINQRLRALDREWDVERLIEVEAPLMVGLGIALGLANNRKWFGLSAIAASMVILHSFQGWYPLLPIFRRLGIRSQNEIEQERIALRALRGDYEAYQYHNHSSH